jgi:hypothetical protein
MSINDYIVYGFWGALPLIQIFITIYQYLEYLSRKGNKIAAIDAAKQSGFLIICLMATFLFELFLLDFIYYGTNYLTEMVGFTIPRTFLRLILFPLVLVFGAKMIGGSKELQPPKNPLLKYNRSKNGAK